MNVYGGNKSTLDFIQAETEYRRYKMDESGSKYQYPTTELMTERKHGEMLCLLSEKIRKLQLSDEYTGKIILEMNLQSGGISGKVKATVDL